MDLEGMMLNKSDRERQTPYDLTYMWTLLKKKKNKIKTTSNSQTQRIDLMVARNGGWGGMKWLRWSKGTKF